MDIAALIRPNILTLEPYHSAREKIQEGVLLDANENPYSQEWQGIGVNRYPDPYQRKLRKAIARYLGVQRDRVVAGVGSDEILDWIFKVFCQPGKDHIAIAEPTYGMYQVTANIFGIPCFEFGFDEGFSLSAARFLERVPSDAKVLFLCSPNNPTGNWLERKQILQIAQKWQKIVVVDEAYIEFADQPSLVSDLNEVPNVILLRTLSKAFGQAGVRLGYAAAFSPDCRPFLEGKGSLQFECLNHGKGMPGTRSGRKPSGLRFRDSKGARKSGRSVEGYTTNRKGLSFSGQLFAFFVVLRPRSFVSDLWRKILLFETGVRSGTWKIVFESVLGLRQKMICFSLNYKGL